ncbi:MAG: EAL domain-containing protein, partial [Nostoc sp.]
RQMQAWQIQFPADPPLTISVNLSTKQFSEPTLIERIKQIIQETGLEGSNLKLEITESVLMANIQLATFMILQLQEMNIELHLDDFGTGYSSLSYLHRFPSTVLKIDRSFITKMGANGENLEIIQAIISLAQSLNKDVIAEGVETEEQMTQLRAMKCKYAQGYFLSQALDSNLIERLMVCDIHLRQG